MTITRANVETILTRRAGNLMSALGLAVTYAGSNADLNDPIGYALRKLGYAVASITAVADADLAGLAVADIDALLDLAEYRLLESVVGNWNLADITVLARSEKLGALRPDKRLEQLAAKLAEYGVGAGTLQTGMISLDFAEHVETNE